jgi:hypothetical protein
MAEKYPDIESEKRKDYIYPNDVDIEELSSLNIDVATFSEIDTVEPRIRDILFRPVLQPDTILDIETYQYLLNRLLQKQKRVLELIQELRADMKTLKAHKDTEGLNEIWGKDTEEQEEKQTEEETEQE